MPLVSNSKSTFVFGILLVIQSVSAEDLISDFMVRLPMVGYYFMNNDQKQIYAYNKRLNRIVDLHNRFYNPNTYSTQLESIVKTIAEKCESNPAFNKYPREVITQHITDIYNAQDSTNPHKIINFLPNSYVLNKEHVDIIDQYIKKNQSSWGFKQLAEAISINDKIQEFRKTDLYKISNLSSIKSAISVREDALKNIDYIDGKRNNIKDKIKDKELDIQAVEENLKKNMSEKRLNMKDEIRLRRALKGDKEHIKNLHKSLEKFYVKMPTSSFRYGANVLRSFEFDKMKSSDHINRNLNQLNAIKLDLQKRVKAFKAVDR